MNTTANQIIAFMLLLLAIVTASLYARVVKERDRLEVFQEEARSRGFGTFRSDNAEGERRFLWYGLPMAEPDKSVTVGSKS